MIQTNTRKNPHRFPYVICLTTQHVGNAFSLSRKYDQLTLCLSLMLAQETIQEADAINLFPIQKLGIRSHT
jgi:hypothetical protein